MNKNERQRHYRLLNNNSCTKKYEKTKNGFLMRLYRNMKSRVLGIQKAKKHLYVGKNLLDKKDFYDWANSSNVFHKMFLDWENSKYDRKLCPTVDRIDSTKGYQTNNMQWLTHSENSRKGAVSKTRK